MGVGGWELICASLVSRLFQPGVAGRWHPRAECSLEARVQGTHSVARPSVPAFLRADAGFAFQGLFVIVGVTGRGKRR